MQSKCLSRRTTTMTSPSLHKRSQTVSSYKFRLTQNTRVNVPSWLSVSRQLPNVNARFHTQALHAGFVVNQPALRKASFRIRGLTRSTVTPPALHILHHLGGGGCAHMRLQIQSDRSHTPRTLVITDEA